MVLPSGAVNPATYPTTGFVRFFPMSAAARSSASPPISPIITIASVSGSASNASSASMCGPDDRVTADPDRRGKPEMPQFEHHLIGQRAGLRHQPDPAGSGDVRRDDPRAVRPDDPRLVTRLHGK